MKVLCVSGSRADYGSIRAVRDALLKYNVETEIMEHGFYRNLEDFDIVVLEGDRHEILKTALDCFLAKKVIIHLGGGDITEGSQDDSMRHAITKLSHLHFATNAESAKRIIQLGEEPWRVKVVGEPAVDKLVTYDKEVATKLVGAEDYILVVWHPNTLVSEGQVLAETAILANALEVSTPMKKLVIGPNNDAGGSKIAHFMKNWCEFTHNKYVATLPRDVYLTLLRHAKCLVGNSSSGYFEAPSFGTPVVDVGDRQKGRIEWLKLIHTDINMDKIAQVIPAAIEMRDMKTIATNPYEKDTLDAADRIAKEIFKMVQPGHDPKRLLVKRFYAIKH